VFDLQDQIATSVAGVIEPTLRQAEIERARRKRPDSLDAYDLYLRALPFAYTSMPEDADKALGYLEQAIRLDADFAVVHAIIAWCHEQRYLRGGLDENAKAIALRHAHLAIAMGGNPGARLRSETASDRGSLRKELGRGQAKTIIAIAAGPRVRICEPSVPQRQSPSRLEGVKAIQRIAEGEP